MTNRFAVFCSAVCLFLSACSSADDDVFSEKQLAEFRDELNVAMASARSTSGPGKPLMWTLKDNDTSIHLFGPVHILPPNLEWRSDEFNAAFAATDTLIMETVDGDPAEEEALIQQMMSNAMYPPGETLRDNLSPREFEMIEIAANDVGLPITAIEQMQPWFVALNFELMIAAEQGYVNAEGVEVVLEAEAIAAGKELGALETSEFQTSLFDNLSEQAQLEYLLSSAAFI